MKEIYTLIVGLSIISFLLFLYIRYKIKKLKIGKKVINGGKDIQRMYYILKKNNYKILKLGKLMKFYIIFDDKKIKNELYINAIVKKDKKYLCFISNNYEITEKMILYNLLTNIYNGLIIDVENFNIKEYRIKQ